MPTLYVKNFPGDLYLAVRKQARKNRSSIAAEVISLLRCNIPTAGEPRRRREFYDRMTDLRSSYSNFSVASAEKMILQERNR